MTYVTVAPQKSAKATHEELKRNSKKKNLKGIIFDSFMSNNWRMFRIMTKIDSDSPSTESMKISLYIMDYMLVGKSRLMGK